MFRRFVASLVAVLCLFAGIGLPVQQHFCMGEASGMGLAPIEVTEEASHACPTCGMTKAESEGCCQDVYKVLKGESHERYFATPVAVTAFDWIIPSRPPFFAVREARTDYALAAPVPFTRPPPEPDDGLPRYLRLRVLRI